MMVRVPDPAAAEAKRELRLALRGRRLARDEAERMRVGMELARRVLELPELAGVGTVAAYVSSPAEPGTGPLIGALGDRGIRVLLPVLRPDLDLDWAQYAGRLQPSGVPGRSGLMEPAGPRLGPDAVAAAGLVLVPALAVGPDGARLGQGGGSYDRALARVPVGVPVAALLYDGEFLAEVPAEPHDRAVNLVVQPAGVRWLPPEGSDGMDAGAVDVR
jgi:5-formyltetrahydrofolate cyclo-ligase